MIISKLVLLLCTNTLLLNAHWYLGVVDLSAIAENIAGITVDKGTLSSSSVSSLWLSSTKVVSWILVIWGASGISLKFCWKEKGSSKGSSWSSSVSVVDKDNILGAKEGSGCFDDVWIVLGMSFSKFFDGNDAPIDPIDNSGVLTEVNILLKLLMNYDVFWIPNCCRISLMIR